MQSVSRATQIAFVWLVFPLWLAAVCQSALIAQRPGDDNDIDATQDADYLFQQFSSLEFDLDDDTVVEDADATSEGRIRMTHIESRAGELYRELKKLQEEVSKYALPRDRLVVEWGQARQKLATAITHGNVAIQHIEQLRLRMQQTPGSMHGPLQKQIKNAQSILSRAQSQAASARKDIEIREPKIVAYNNQIEPLVTRMKQLWNELEECRAQWCSLAQPALKYARGDFERLRSVLDSWLLIDGLWPSAFVWAALCAYELGDSEGAINYIRDADALRATWGVVLPWPAVSATQALVLRNMPGNVSKNHAKYLSTANARMNKLERSRLNNEWDAYFILGRLYSERESEHAKAAAMYERGLKHNPHCVCSQVGLARLQVSSQQESVRDLEQGIAILEKIWNKSATKSWRLAGDLARAYDEAKRTADAARMWKFIQDSDATDKQKTELRARLVAARNRS